MYYRGYVMHDLDEAGMIYYTPSTYSTPLGNADASTVIDSGPTYLYLDAFDSLSVGSASYIDGIDLDLVATFGHEEQHVVGVRDEYQAEDFGKYCEQVIRSDQLSGLLPGAYHSQIWTGSPTRPLHYRVNPFNPRPKQ